MGNTFTYQALDKAGQTVKGVIEADSINLAATRLKEKGYIIKNLKAKSGIGSVLNKEIHLSGVKMKDLALFCRQFSTMLNAGIPVIGGLNILVKQSINPLIGAAVSEVVHDLERGKTLSEALKLHPKVFPPLMVNMVEAGEMGGILDKSFERLASYYQREAELKSKVVSAMIYPAIVSIIAMVVVAVMIIFALPQFVGIFADIGADLPVSTKILLSFSNLVQENFLVCLIITVGAALFIMRFLKTDYGKKFWDKFVLSMPMFGEITRKVLTSRFSRTLGSLLASGVPVLKAMDMVKKLADNYYLNQGIAGAQIALREGKIMWEPLQKAKIFDPMVIQMIAIGEETGSVDQMLDKIANIYDAEVEESVNRLTSLIEPVIIAILAVVVGFIAVSILLPMFDVYKNFNL